MKEFEKNGKKNELTIDAEEKYIVEKTGPTLDQFNGMPSYHADDKWVQQYINDFGTEPSFF